MLGERAAVLETTNDLVTVRQLIDIVASLEMSLERENLAVDAKATDAVVNTVFQGDEKSFRVEGVGD